MQGYPGQRYYGGNEFIDMSGTRLPFLRGVWDVSANTNFDGCDLAFSSSVESLVCDKFVLISLF